MEFMKRAIQKQREEAKLEAEKLIQALQEEKEFDKELEGSEEEQAQEEDEEEDEEAKAIREALASGSLKRNKKETKSLEVKEAISIKQVGMGRECHVAFVCSS